LLWRLGRGRGSAHRHARDRAVDARGDNVRIDVDHYSLLRTTEEMLGLTTYLGEAANAVSMRSAFGL
jgi:hypothetical protein